MVNEDESPDLNRGITFATFRSLGTTPVFRETEKTWVNGSMIDDNTSLTKLLLMLSCPAAEFFSFKIISYIYFDVGGSNVHIDGY